MENISIDEYYTIGKKIDRKRMNGYGNNSLCKNTNILREKYSTDNVEIEN